MNAILAMALNAAVSYLQTPAGQERLVSLVPTIVNGLHGIVDRMRDGAAAGVPVEEQAKAGAAHITELIAAAAVKADADHAADPTDTAFDQGVFRD